jgi:DNA-binding MarR family transcriptional regulator
VDFNIGLLLYIPYRALEDRVFEAIVAAGFTDITVAQSRVFQRISAQGSRITELAERARVTKQTASALVQALEDGRYVERVPDPVDARARLVRVAARGAAATAVAAAEIELIAAEWRRELGAARYGRLVRDLEMLRRLTDR